MSLQIADVRPLRVYGVPGTQRMHALFFHELLKADVAQRLGYGYKPELYTDMTVDEWTPGVVFDEDGLRITAAEVVHPVYTLALRFDYAGRGLVMGADTSYCENLIELSRRADLLVADAVAIEPPASVTLSPAAREILAKIYQGHASPDEVGLMAHKAGVRSVVLSHIMGRFEFDSNDVIAQCRRQFSGEVRVAEDLEVYDV